jgi:hypothetical protein
MNYEFFFLQERGSRKPPRLIRVYCDSADRAAFLLARRFAYAGAPEGRKAIRTFLRTRNIRPASVLTVFPRTFNADRRGPEAA